MAYTPVRWTVAVGEGAPPVAEHEGPPPGAAEQPLCAPDVQHGALGAEHGRDELGIAGQPAGQRRGDQLPVRGRRRSEGVGQRA